MEKVGKQGRKRLEWKGAGLEIRMSVEVHSSANNSNTNSKTLLSVC